MQPGVVGDPRLLVQCPATFIFATSLAAAYLSLSISTFPIAIAATSPGAASLAATAGASHVLGWHFG